jgi:hypothetical protein
MIRASILFKAFGLLIAAANAEEKPAEPTQPIEPCVGLGCIIIKPKSGLAPAPNIPKDGADPKGIGPDRDVKKYFEKLFK